MASLTWLGSRCGYVSLAQGNVFAAWQWNLLAADAARNARDPIPAFPEACPPSVVSGRSRKNGADPKNGQGVGSRGSAYRLGGSASDRREREQTMISVGRATDGRSGSWIDSDAPRVSSSYGSGSPD